MKKKSRLGGVYFLGVDTTCFMSLFMPARKDKKPVIGPFKKCKMPFHFTPSHPTLGPLNDVILGSLITSFERP